MDTPRRVALLLEYDGTNFAGSQSQRCQRTVQDIVEEAVAQFLGQQRRVSFAGRTDAGVHALGQVASVLMPCSRNRSIIRDALNHRLPADVAVRAVADVEQYFDPRRQATRRTYRYRLVDGAAPNPLSRWDTWHRRNVLDERAMGTAAATLPLNEERDWAAFGGRTPEGYSTIRTMHRCEVERDGRTVSVTMTASGFLPHQVRRTVGALERVGQGKMTQEAFSRLIDAEPGSVGPTAPPRGLTLIDVEYPQGLVAWEWN